MDTTSLADIPSHLVLVETPATDREEDSPLEADHAGGYCDMLCDMCWDDDMFSSWSPEDSDGLEYRLDDANPIFDFHDMKARRASRHTIERYHTALARRRRTTKRDVIRANRSHEPIGSRNDVWREDLEKGAFATYNRRRCRCDYCIQLDTLAQERQTLRWVVRRAEQGKDWRGGGWNKKPRWVDYDWDVECGEGDAGENGDSAGSVFEPGRVPPMEACLSELVRIRRPRCRRAVQSILLPCSVLASRGTEGLLLATEPDPSIEPTSPNLGSEPLCSNDGWEVLSLYSEWDQCSVQSL